MPEQPDEPAEENCPEPEDTPTEEPQEWKDIGRRLFAEELERVRYETFRDAFLDAEQAVLRGNELSKEHVLQMRHAVEDAKRLTRIAASLSPETAPEPRIEEFLSEESREEFRRLSRERLGVEDETETE